MTLKDFKDSISQPEPDQALPALLTALWFDKKGEWNRAHQIAQQIPSADGSWVHAYLHRREGDLGNALYWYRRANRPEAKVSLEQEWEQIAQYLLDNQA